MNSLEKSFNGILDKYGHSILLVHTDKKTTCSCFNKLTGMAQKSCPVCFGLGTVPVIKKEITRDMDVQVPMSLPFIQNQYGFGDMAIPARSYFFKKHVELKEDDLIVEVEWNGEQPVYTGSGIYEIAHIDPQRFINGELTFLKVYVKDQPVKKKIRGINIVNKAGEITYQFETEGGLSE